MANLDPGWVDLARVRLPPAPLEAPEIDVHIVDSREDPGGVGEPGLPPAAPALTNAWFALTGRHVRELPMAPQD